jgi:hypothetical protein
MQTVPIEKVTTFKEKFSDIWNITKVKKSFDDP